MKTTRITAVILSGAVAAAALAGTAGAAPAHKSISFSGKYSGTAALLINGDAITIQKVSGKGSGSVIGSGSISGKGNATSTQGVACAPFTGTGTIKGAKGTIKFSVNTSSQGCGNSQTPPITVTVTGSAKVTGGTGATKGAKGTLKFSGTLNLNGTSGAQSGAFTGKLSGKLTVG